MATVSERNYHDEIYTEVRSYLIGLFSCPVVKGYQNNSPLPENGIVMTIIHERDFDQASDYTDEDLLLTYVQNSTEVMMQLDFYGELAAGRARQVVNFWRNEYTTSRLKVCQPLHSKQPVQMQHVNEKNMYEQRWMLEIYLQYNPEFSYELVLLGAPTITIERA